MYNVTLRCLFLICARVFITSAIRTTHLKWLACSSELPDFTPVWHRRYYMTPLPGRSATWSTSFEDSTTIQYLHVDVAHGHVLVTCSRPERGLGRATGVLFSSAWSCVLGTAVKSHACLQSAWGVETKGKP